MAKAARWRHSRPRLTGVLTMPPMIRIALELLAALALMAVLFSVAFLLSTTTPQVHIGWFFGGAGLVYSMLVLFYLNR